MKPIAARAERPTCAAAAEVVETALRGKLPWMALRALGIAVGQAATKLRCADLADLCSCPRRTLHRRLSSAGIGSATQTIGWGRVLAACYFLDRGLTLEDVAESLRMDGAPALIHLFRRHVGLTPGTIREAGGLATAIYILRATIAGQRVGDLAPLVAARRDVAFRWGVNTFWPTESQDGPSRQKMAPRDSVRTPT